MFLRWFIKDVDMARNLDVTTLRSFITVADQGGVTRAAGLLNLTQSAVSMQIKRIEDLLGIELFDRSGRGLTLSAAGDQLLGYARRITALNDEVFGRLTAQEYSGTITLGVPSDIVYPAIPQILQRFAVDYPRVKVQLISSFTRLLKNEFAKGQIDVMLTTEDAADRGGEKLTTRELVWVGAPGGQAWRQRPLRLAFEDRCFFRQGAQRRLDEAGIPWEMAVEGNYTRTIEATVSADLAVHAMLAGTEPHYFERVAHGGALPELRQMQINLYCKEQPDRPVVSGIAEMIRAAFQAG